MSNKLSNNGRKVKIKENYDVTCKVQNGLEIEEHLLTSYTKITRIVENE